MRPLDRFALLSILAAVLGGCAVPRAGSVRTAVDREQPLGPEGLTVAMLQSEVMGFADTHVSFVFQAADEVINAADTPEIRRDAHKAKLATALGAWTIATDPNPAVAVLDMIVMVKLEHDSYRQVGPHIFGEHAGTLLAAYARGEEQIDALATKALWPEEREALAQLIQQWRRNNPDQWAVSHVRFDDFAGHRRLTQTSAKTGGSMFTLVGLDPLAKMDPTLRQVEQSRLLGERIFFFVSRMPALLSWQTEALYYRLVSTPETQHLLASTDRFAQLGEQLVARSEALPDEVADRFAVERTATIDQLQRAVQEEREGLLEDLEASTEMLADVRATLEAGTTLSESLKSTTESVSVLAERFRSPQPSSPAPPGEPVELQDVRDTITETSVMVRDLNELALTLDRMLASPQIAELDGALARAESSGRRLMNHAALLIAGIVGLIFGGVFLRSYVRRRERERAAPPGAAPGRPVVEIETVPRPAKSKRAPLAGPPA